MNDADNQPQSDEDILNSLVEADVSPIEESSAGSSIDPRSAMPMAEGGAVPLAIPMPNTQAPLANPASNQTTDEQLLNGVSDQDMLDTVDLDNLDSDEDPLVAAQKAKYGTTGQMIKTGLEGAAQGVLGPAAPYLEKKLLGVKDEDILGRKEVNTFTHGAGEAVGLMGSMATGVGEGALAAKAGMALAPKVVEGTTLAARIGSTAARASIENAVIQAGDETSSMIINDPNTSAGSALASVGLAGVLGGAIGGTIASTHPFFKMVGDTKIGQLIEDFKGRIDDHLTTPDPVAATHEELSTLYKNMKDTADDVFGPGGLKAKDIRKAVPEMNGAIHDQVGDIFSTVDDKIKRMMGDEHSYPPRLTKKLSEDLNAYSSKVTTPGATSADVFEAAQELKQTLQGYAKYEKRIAPFAEEYDFVRDSKKLASHIKESLEDGKVWGKAAERQKSINGAFTRYLPTLQDFERKFTTETAADGRIVDKGKIQTYINQLDKAAGDGKKGVLTNFLKASEKYHADIADTHTNLGLDAPIEYGSLHHTNKTLQKQTTGGRLADIFIDKGLTDAGSKGLGAAAGAGVGANFGAPVMGALVGSHVLGPFFKSVLPAIVKPMLETANNSKGLKAAIDYGMAVVRGETMLNKATKAVFTPGKDIVVDKATHINSRNREKLDKQLQDIQRNPAKLLNSASNNDLNHYMPRQSAALSQSSGNAVAYLNSLRPNTDPKSPLDSRRITSSSEKAAFTHALDIAQNPTIVLDKVKDGSITSQDIKTLHAVAPELYANMSQKLFSQMNDHIVKGNPVPYQTRLGISKFLGQPMDSTMQPMSIIAAQPQPSQGPSAQQAPGQTPKHSTAPLSKLPNEQLTASQAREKRSMKV